MRCRFGFIPAVVTAALLAVLGCSDGGGSQTDARVDAPPIDGGTDGGTDGGIDAPTDASTDAPPATAVCTVTAGSTVKLLTGTVLTPTGPLANGQIRIDAGGNITCVGMACAQGGETRIDCPMGVISPGLINTHDHITYTQNPPYTDTGERYEQRHDWRRGQRGHTRITTPGSATADQIRWGELRMLMGGATSIVGSGGQPGLLRNLDQAPNQEGLGQAAVNFETFPLDDSGGTQIASTCNYGAAPDTTASIAGNAAYEPHISEGIDAEAHNEFLCTSDSNQGTPSAYDSTAPGLSTDLVQPQTAIIHGVALRPYDYGLMALDGAALIWSPRSNITLYGDTAWAPVAARMGVQIALGTDWSATGSINLLRELQCADHVNRTYWGSYFTDAQLWQMVTQNAAAVTATDDVIGSLVVGRVADIAVFDGRVHTGYRAIIDGEPKDVVLVMRGGKPLYGEADTMAALATGCDAVDVCGNPKQVCLMSEVGKTYGALMAGAGTAYPAFFCGTPTGEPVCTPRRPASVAGSTIYTGMSAAGDMDGDGVPDASDDCPAVFNPIRPLDGGAQADGDGDGAGDACDVCPTTPNATTCTAVDPNDRDGDTVVNALDNCPDIANTNQADGDMDGKGDVCDLCPTVANPGTAGCPVTIYSIKDGTTMVGANVRVTNALVTGKGSNGFFVQVKEGDAGYLGANNSGLFVFTTATSPFLPMVAVGNRVTVDATVALFNGQLELANIVSVTTNGMTEAPPAPITVTAAEVATGGSRATPLESVIVRIATPVTVTAVDATFNEFTVNDGGGAVAVDDFLFLTAPLPTVGAQYGSVTGVLAFRNLASKIEIRSAADLGPAALDVSAFGPATSYASINTTATPTFPTALTVTINQVAPAGGTAIRVTSSNNAVAQVPGDTVTVPAGMSSVTVPVTAGAAAGTATLSAALATAPISTLTATVRVLDGTEVPVLTSLTPTSATAAPSGTVTFTVGLSLPAPTGGTAVTIAASAGTAPATVTVPAGQLTATFTYTAAATPGAATVTATLAATTLTATVTVAVATGGLVINEVDYDQAGTDANSFIEVYNGTGAPVTLADYAVVLVNGNGNAEYARFALGTAGTTLPAGGYLVIGNATIVAALPGGTLAISATGDFIQNGAPDGVALINTTTGALFDALSYEGSITMAAITGITGTVNLVEMTAFATADTNDNLYSLARSPNGRDTNNAATDWTRTMTITPGAANP